MFACFYVYVFVVLAKLESAVSVRKITHEPLDQCFMKLPESYHQVHVYSQLKFEDNSIKDGHHSQMTLEKTNIATKQPVLQIISSKLLSSSRRVLKVKECLFDQIYQISFESKTTITLLNSNVQI